MKKIVLIAAVAGLTLVGAAPPAHWSRDGGEEWTGRGYPPCSRTVTDRCIQLYERGVATRTNLALNERLGMQTYAMGGPYEPYEADETRHAYAEDQYPGGEEEAYAEAGPEVDAGWAPAHRGDYPPCSHGVTDRCIQLYERGVGADD